MVSLGSKGIGTVCFRRLYLMGYDNRTVLSRYGLGLGQRILDRVQRHGDLHLMCRIGDVKLGYCYIRKNACSSFKRLFLDMGDQAYDPEIWPRKIDYMTANQMMRSRDASECDHNVFVYRDPVARTVSLFKNKFIMRDGHEDLFHGSEALTGMPPEKTTFRHFVEGYLRPDFRALDLHVLPQSWHLKRFYYSDAIPIADLHAHMTTIIGDKLADQYFKKPVNATHLHHNTSVSEAAETPARDLAEAYANDGVMPSDESFLKDSLVARIRELYADDTQMIENVKAA